MGGGEWGGENGGSKDHMTTERGGGLLSQSC